MEKERTLLLVDDEPNILSALTRLLRPNGYRILRAGSGREGLELLAQNEVGVIMSDQRMPEMTGVEFLRTVKERHPDTVRIVLSGYTELNSITEAINQGAIYKFLTKPWDDELLRANVNEAFMRHELKSENIRLAAELKAINEELEKRVREKTEEVVRSLKILEVSQEVLECLPVAVIGIGADGVVVIANGLARELLESDRPLVGENARDVLAPELLTQNEIVTLRPADGSGPVRVRCWRESMGRVSGSQGVVLALVPLMENTGLAA